MRFSSSDMRRSFEVLFEGLSRDPDVSRLKKCRLSLMDEVLRAVKVTRPTLVTRVMSQPADEKSSEERTDEARHGDEHEQLKREDERCGYAHHLAPCPTSKRTSSFVI